MSSTSPEQGGVAYLYRWESPRVDRTTLGLTAVVTRPGTEPPAVVGGPDVLGVHAVIHEFDSRDPSSMQRDAARLELTDQVIGQIERVHGRSVYHVHDPYVAPGRTKPESHIVAGSQITVPLQRSRELPRASFYLMADVRDLVDSLHSGGAERAGRQLARYTALTGQQLHIDIAPSSAHRDVLTAHLDKAVAAARSTTRPERQRSATRRPDREPAHHRDTPGTRDRTP